MIGLIIFLLLGDINSLKNMAEVRPNGAATNIAIIEVTMVPVISGKNPKLGSLLSGAKSVLNTSDKGISAKNFDASTNKVNTIPMEVRIEIEAIKNKVIGTIFSNFDDFLVFIFRCLLNIFDRNYSPVMGDI